MYFRFNDDAAASGSASRSMKDKTLLIISAKRERPGMLIDIVYKPLFGQTEGLPG